MLYIIFLLVDILCASQNGIIFTGSGEEIHCKILKIENDAVLARTINNRDTTIALSSIVRIQFLRGFAGDDWQNINDISDPLLSAIVKKYLKRKPLSDVAVEVLYDERVWTLRSDSSYTFEHRRIVRVNNEAGIEAENSKFYYYFPDNSSIELLFARSIDPSGSITNITENSVEYSSPFGYVPQYDRLRRLKFALGGLEVGSIMDYKIRINVQRSSCIEPFSAEEPLLEQSYTVEKIVRIDMPREIGLRLFVNMKDKVLLDSVFSDDRKVYQVRVKDAVGVIDEPMMPPEIYIMPKVFFSIYSSWEDIALELRKKLDLAYDKPELLDGILDSLKRGREDPLAIAKSIYYWVLSGFVFEDVPMRMFRMYPRNLSEIVRGGHINALDAAFLYYAFLRRAGLNPDIVFVRTADDGFLPDSVASVKFFDTPLVCFGRDSTVFVYLGNPYYDFGILPQECYGKGALSINTGKIVRIREANFNDCRKSIKYDIFCDDSLNLDVTRKTISYGNCAVEQKKRARMSRNKLIREEEERLSSIFADFVVRDVEFYGVGYDSVPVFEVNYSGSGFFNINSDEYLMFRLPEIYSLLSSETAISKRYPMYIGFPRSYDIEFLLRLPPKIEPIIFSREHRFERGPFRYCFYLSYDDSSRVLSVSVKDEVSAGLYPLHSFYDFLEYVKTKIKSVSEWVVLRKVQD